MRKGSTSTLTEIETELIAFFVSAAQAIGLPRSYGEIYGLFFASNEPLSLDDVIERLEISKGSASQGIRFLRSINALNLAYLPGDRRDHYTAETSLRRIADGFIKERITPQLDEGSQRLSYLKERYSSTELKSIESKLKNIDAWRKKAGQILPVVSKFLGSRSRGPKSSI